MNMPKKKWIRLFGKSELCWKDFPNNKIPRIRCCSLSISLHILMFFHSILKCFRHVQTYRKYSNALQRILADGDMYKCCITCIVGSIRAIFGCQNFFCTFASLPITMCAQAPAQATITIPMLIVRCDDFACILYVARKCSIRATNIYEQISLFQCIMLHQHQPHWCGGHCHCFCCNSIEHNI